MKYDRGVIVLGFNAELTLQSLDGNTHSLMSDCPEDLNHIMDLVAADMNKKIGAYLEHLREGHQKNTYQHTELCGAKHPNADYYCTRKKHDDTEQHRYGGHSWGTSTPQTPRM